MCFLLHEWNNGLANGVQHNLRLMDERPFRERSQRLAPGDVDDVRRHIQELESIKSLVALMHHL